MPWPLAKAKDRLSEIIRRAVDQGPQVISVRGKEVAVVVSRAQWGAQNSGTGPSFKDHLLAIPKGDELDLSRNRAPARVVEF